MRVGKRRPGSKTRLRPAHRDGVPQKGTCSTYSNEQTTARKTNSSARRTPTSVGILCGLAPLRDSPFYCPHRFLLAAVRVRFRYLVSTAQPVETDGDFLGGDRAGGEARSPSSRGQRTGPGSAADDCYANPA